MPVLRSIDGPHGGRVHALKARWTVIGRNPDCCDIVLDSSAVSRLHARIERADDGCCYIEDPGSHNGTYVNSELLRRGPPGRRRLEHNDAIEICGFRFLFEAADPDESSVLLTRDAAGASPHITSKIDISSRRTDRVLDLNPAAKLRLVLGIIEDSAGVDDLKELLSKVLDRLFSAFQQAERGFVMLRSEGDQKPAAQVAKRRDGAYEQIRFSRTIVDKVLREKTAVLSTGADNEEPLPATESIVQLRLRSIMCVPLIDSKGGSLGVIELDVQDQARRFARDDLDVLAGVARHVAIVIENARLHEDALRQQKIKHEMDRMRRELTLAREIQRTFLPGQPPPLPQLEFYDFYQPAEQVGGDYYDYIRLPGDRLAILVADVVGEGVPASLLMARFAAETRFCLVSEPTPLEAISRLNQNFVQVMRGNKFITLVLAVFPLGGGEITIINAGHWPPLLRREGQVQVLRGPTTDFPLGLMDDCSFHQESIPFEPGDQLALFTDGVMDASNAEGERYGIERFSEKIASGGAGVRELGAELLGDLRRFVGDQRQVDDMCFLLVGRTSA